MKEVPALLRPLNKPKLHLLNKPKLHLLHKVMVYLLMMLQCVMKEKMVVRKKIHLKVKPQLLVRKERCRMVMPLSVREKGTLKVKPLLLVRKKLWRSQCQWRTNHEKRVVIKKVKMSPLTQWKQTPNYCSVIL